MKRNCYLVTGAAGFIGGAVARRLISCGHDVWTIDNLSTGAVENVPEGVKLVKGDCQSEDVIQLLKCQRFDAILHIAGQSSGEISFDDPAYDLRTNTESTLRLVKFGLSTGCKRFLYASSMSVYGEVAEGPIAEDLCPKPVSFYGVGKLASEHYLRIYQSKGLQPTALRYFNVYGPNQNMKNLRQGMVSIFLAQWLRQEQVIVKGDLSRFRDFVYIDDVVEATLAALDNPSTYGRVFNIASGRMTTVRELLSKIEQLSGLKREIVVADGTPGDQRGIYADINLANSVFGYKCRWDLEEGLKEMILWAQAARW